MKNAIIHAKIVNTESTVLMATSCAASSWSLFILWAIVYEDVATGVAETISTVKSCISLRPITYAISTAVTGAAIRRMKRLETMPSLL